MSFAASASTSTNHAVQQRERKRATTWTRPDRKRAFALKRDVETFTIKTGLNSICNDIELRDLVHRTVIDLTQLQWEASKIVQLYVLSRIDANLPLHALDWHFFYHALVCATGSQRALLPQLWQAH